ncbi:obscurin-like isoform X2 [Sycon ciliatum]|uniref:obscurin-like isoform X2 n=1 Tax=Sycon ciliatum TaxID=27933 RepID=UPI0031F66BEC
MSRSAIRKRFSDRSKQQGPRREKKQQLSGLRSVITEAFWCGEVSLSAEELGRGSYAAVYQAQHNGVDVAGKVLSESVLPTADDERRAFLQRFNECIALWGRLRHPRLLHFVGIGFHATPEQQLYRLCLVHELMGTTLEMRIGCDPGDSPTQRMAYLADVAEGIRYLHARGAVHGDLKPRNVLLAAGRAKIADSGLAHFLVAEQQREPGRESVEFPRLNVFDSSLPYLAPEFFSSADPVGRCDAAFDIFSCGVMILAVLTNKQPSPTEQRGRVNSSEGGAERPVPEVQRRKADLDLLGDDQALRSLVLSCLDDSASCRPSAEVLHQHILDAMHSSKVASTVQSHLQDVCSTIISRLDTAMQSMNEQLTMHLAFTDQRLYSIEERMRGLEMNVDAIAQHLKLNTITSGSYSRASSTTSLQAASLRSRSSSFGTAPAAGDHAQGYDRMQLPSAAQFRPSSSPKRHHHGVPAEHLHRQLTYSQAQQRLVPPLQSSTANVGGGGGESRNMSRSSSSSSLGARTVGQHSQPQAIVPPYVRRDSKPGTREVKSVESFASVISATYQPHFGASVRDAGMWRDIGKKPGEAFSHSAAASPRSPMALRKPSGGHSHEDVPGYAVETLHELPHDESRQSPPPPPLQPLQQQPPAPREVAPPLATNIVVANATADGATPVASPTPPASMSAAASPEIPKPPHQLADESQDEPESSPAGQTTESPSTRTPSPRDHRSDPSQATEAIASQGNDAEVLDAVQGPLMLPVALPADDTRVRRVANEDGTSDSSVMLKRCRRLFGNELRQVPEWRRECGLPENTQYYCEMPCVHEGRFYAGFSKRSAGNQHHAQLYYYKLDAGGRNTHTSGMAFSNDDNGRETSEWTHVPLPKGYWFRQCYFFVHRARLHAALIEMSPMSVYQIFRHDATPHGRTWTYVTQLPDKRYLFGLAVVGDKVVVIGGRGGRNIVDPLLKTVYSTTLSVAAGNTSAAGGGGDNDTTGGVTWTSLDDLPQPCASPRPAVSPDNLLHVLGHFGVGSGANGLKVTDMLTLDMKARAADRRWRGDAVHRLPLSRAAGVFLGSAFVVAGGLSEQGTTTGVYLYNASTAATTATSDWVQLPSLVTARYMAHCVVHRQRLYCFAGHDGAAINDIEVLAAPLAQEAAEEPVLV